MKKIAILTGIVSVTGVFGIRADTWTQTDWSGGSGQEYWSDSTMYWEGVNVDDTSSAGDLILPAGMAVWQDGDPNWMQIGDSSNILVSGGNVRVNISTVAYDFADTVNNEAYEGADTLRPPAGLDIGTEFSAGEYDSISSSDDMRFRYSQDDTLRYDFHRFKFKIDEPVLTIGNIYVEHEGWGYGVLGPGFGHSLYIWDVNGANWAEVSSEVGSDSDFVLSSTYTDNFSHYLDSLGYLQLLTQPSYKGGGCCPFLYTWNGEEFVFISDVNSAGGLGYPDATLRQEFYRPQSEDYIKINGDELRPRDGFYCIEIGEDQNEITYLDRSKMLVVDHLEGTEIYSPRLFTYVEPPPFNIHTTRAPINARAATDEHGNDILHLISKVDRNYTNAEQYHWNVTTVDLGDLSAARVIKLLYNAFIEWPSEQDVIMKSAHPVYGETETPYAPYVEVINENGEWQRVSGDEHFGLPDARPRTKIVNITDWFKTCDYRIRIHNFYEVHIDWVAVDTTEDEAVEVTELDPASTELYWKGVALQYSPDGKRPLIADYYRTVSAPGFEYFEGNFTRYGDVLPLLTSVDDKFVVMQAGDCLSIKFRELPLKDGMERDYYLLSDGYFKEPFTKYLFKDKVAKVEPLPFQKMSAYPYPEDESYAYDREHLLYLEEYNTRKFRSLSVETADHHTIWTDYTKVEIALTRAVLTSSIISPLPLASWSKFYANDSIRQDTTEIIYSILNAESDSVLLDSVTHGQDISSIQADSIKLNAVLISHDTAYSPVLMDWGVDWTYYLASGTVTSSIYGVGVDSVGNWDTITWSSDVPGGTSITVETRTRNDPPDSVWSSWQSCMNGSTVPSPTETRYMQYKTTLTSSGDSTPALHSISIDYSPSSVGVEHITSSEVIPFGFSLSPNPTRGRTVIYYSVPGHEGESLFPVCIRVYGAQGRLVENILDTRKSPGYYSAAWDAKNVSSGTYFCELKIGQHTQIEKITVIR